jgi:hypothetical protein
MIYMQGRVTGLFHSQTYIVGLGGVSYARPEGG